MSFFKGILDEWKIILMQQLKKRKLGIYYDGLLSLEPLLSIRNYIQEISKNNRNLLLN